SSGDVRSERRIGESGEARVPPLHSSIFFSLGLCAPTSEPAANSNRVAANTRLMTALTCFRLSPNVIPKQDQAVCQHDPQIVRLGLWSPCAGSHRTFEGRFAAALRPCLFPAPLPMTLSLPSSMRVVNLTDPFSEISTWGVVPRIPIVATGVSIFMSPVFAIFPATKVKVPLVRLNRVELDFPFGSYTNSFNTMRAELERVKAVPSVKETPSFPSGPVETTSPR